MTPHEPEKIRHHLANLGLALGLLLSWALPAAEPVAPLGFAIGQATRQAVSDGLKRPGHTHPDGTNRYSHGAMLKAAGDKLLLTIVHFCTIVDSCEWRGIHTANH